VFQDGPVLPAHIRRVAVLPLTVLPKGAVAESGQATLAPLVEAELIRAARFEVTAVAAESLGRWTGRNLWAGEEALPPDFFERVRAETGCDAVLFSLLTEYEPYPPLAIGWRIKLVDCHFSKIVWSVDETFNAGAPEVINGARRYSQSNLRQTPVGADSMNILRFPRGFGHYTLSTIFETLPAR
jgi:hypothetical protein